MRQISRFTQINEIHTMTTQIEYALMSANVYGNYPDVNGKNPVRSGNNNLPVPNGWSQIATPDYKLNTPDTGFMASVYTTGSEVELIGVRLKFPQSEFSTFPYGPPFSPDPPRLPPPRHPARQQPAGYLFNAR
jgi:hypothetical protein